MSSLTIVEITARTRFALHDSKLDLTKSKSHSLAGIAKQLRTSLRLKSVSVSSETLLAHSNFSFTSHERFVLEIDPERRIIEGTAELTMQPLDQNLKVIRINSRQCHIRQAFVNNVPVKFTFTDAISELSLGSEADVTHHQSYKSKYLTALREADDGELSIELPEDAVKPISELEAQALASGSFVREDSPEIQDTPIPDEKQQQQSQQQEQQQQQPSSATPAAPNVSYAPLTIRIDYSLLNPRSGLVFVEPDPDVAPYRYYHVYTVNQPLPGGTRAWVPCIDRLSDQCTWDMEFIVPMRLGTAISQQDNEDPFDDEEDTMVICSGEVMEQVVHPFDSSKKIVHYSLAVPTAAPFIGFAVGPFQMIKLTPSQLQEEVLTAANLDENQQQSLLAEINMMSTIYAFALPGHSDELTVSCSFLMHTMHFYGQEYGSYPYADYKIVFVEDAWNDIASSASLSICSSHLLHSADVIDQTYNTRRTLSIALAKQWFGVHIVQKSWPDIWLVIGLANYMASLFIKRHLGNNEYRLRLKRDMDLCCSLDINRPPLYNTALPLPLDPEDLNFIELKAPLVLYMLDKRMCKGGSTLGFSRVIPKILVSAMSGELANNALSTHHFLRLCRKISGFDTRIFADQWIYKSGCPRFNFSYRFNRKKMVVEIYMWQENTNVRGASDSNDYLYTPFFTGNFIVRVHEADGTPYEHILEIQSQSQKFEVQFNTKYKRIRRNTKRFIAKQAAAAAAVAEDDPEKDEEGGQTMLDIIPMLGLGMPVFEDEEQRQEWRIVEWGQDEDDTSGAASATFDWIRLDAEFEWLCILEFQQPDYMWAAQLTKDRDVVAQHEAIEALKRMPSLPTSTSLLRALLDPKTFYKIRMEAAYALASCATPSLGWAGLLQLFKAFQKRYCFPLPQDRMDLDSDIPIVPVVPKPNNFSNLPDYFLQKAMVIAFSEIRDETGLPPLKVRQFLLDLLKYNDNTGNEFSDSYYVATLISAVGDSLIPVGESQGAMDAETEQLLEAAKAEIDRFRTLDYVVPSYHNVVTIACLQTITKLMVNGLMDVDLSMFLLYSRYGNYFEVRCAAFDSLFVLCGLSDDSLVQYFISIIKYDPSTYISHYVARAMLAWLGLAVKEKMSVSHSAGVREEFAEEEGGAAIENDQQKVQGTAQDELYSGIEDLRKRFEANKELQQTLWDMLHSSENLSILDHCIRKYILQLCEYLYKPIDSGLKVTIRMPPTSEQPATSEEAPTEERQAPILRLSMSRPAAAAEIEASEKKQKKSLKRARPETTVPVSPPPSSNASPEPVKPSAPAFDQMPTDQLKNCRRILGKLQKHRSAILFLQPVDEDLDRAPNYYKIIKEPMDLGTVKTKLDRGLYSSFEDFESDIRLIFHNCFLYNRPGTYVYNEGQALEAIFDEELANLRGKEETQNMTIVEGPIPIISPQPVRDKTDMEKCEVVLSNLMENQHAFEFLRPVDPVKQGIPYYFDIIKNPMDLGTVKTKLRNGKYSSIQDFDKDIRLMFRNCYTFNAPTTYVYNEGKMLEEAYDNEWRSVFGQEPRSSSLVDELVTQRQPKPKKRKTEKTEMEKCAFILSNLIDNKHALPFLEPVDPVKLNIPQYFDIIKHPMDLSTIKNKLNSGQYANRIQFNDDVRLMLSNCFTFNPPGNFVHNEGKQLEKVYEKTWSKQFKDEAPQAAANVPTPDSTPVAQVSTPAPQPPPQPPQPSPPPPAAATPAAAPVIQTQQDPAREASPTMPTTTVTVKPAKSDMEKCADILEQTMQDRHSTFFLEPVDPVKLNVPTYFDIIKHPMDLGTIKEKLNSGQYTEPSQLNDDVRLMFNNCYTFNPPKTFVHEEGKLLEKAYERHWKKAFGTKPPGGGASRARSSTISPQTDMEKCTIILEKLMQNRHATAFLLPVDPIALNIPHYFEIIKHPMDLSTIKRKLENHEYSNPNEFDSDVRLMLQNCYTFNPPTNFVHGEGKQLEKAYEREWKKWFK